MRIVGFITLLSCATVLASVHGSAQISERSELQAPSAFDAISDPAMRSRVLFTEAAKVIMNPRCGNLHLQLSFDGQQHVRATRFQTL
jgi:hypothetical protein